MINTNLKLKLIVLAAIISWLLIGASTWLIIFSEANQIPSGIPHLLPKVFYLLFFVAVYTFYRITIGKAGQINLIELLWRVFATGLVTTIISFIIKILSGLLDNTKFIANPFVINFFL